jgi:hypothetical protein
LRRSATLRKHPTFAPYSSTKTEEDTATTNDIVTWLDRVQGTCHVRRTSGALPACIRDPVEGRDVSSKINSSIIPLPEGAAGG